MHGLSTAHKHLVSCLRTNCDEQHDHFDAFYQSGQTRSSQKRKAQEDSEVASVRELNHSHVICSEIDHDCLKGLANDSAVRIRNVEHIGENWYSFVCDDQVKQIIFVKGMPEDGDCISVCDMSLNMDQDRLGGIQVDRHLTLTGKTVLVAKHCERWTS